MTEEERRREARAPIELKVEYKRLNTFFYDYTKNISKGGTFIKTEKPLDIGTIFLFKLSVPVAARRRSRCAARCAGWSRRARRCRRHAGRPRARDGDRSSTTAPTSAQALEQVVEKMMIDSLGPLIYSRLVKKTPKI